MTVITVTKVLSAHERLEALSVIEEVFVKEKQWMNDVNEQIADNPVADERHSWFIARVGGRTAGVMRLFYDPPMELPESCHPIFEPGIELASLRDAGRYVEIGRFMIRHEYRRQYRVALRLMRAATAEVLERDYTHFITDVFKGEEHSPLHFHTRVLGFEVIGSHLYGELNCSATRIILTLDLLKFYNRIKDSKSRIYQELIEGLRSHFERDFVKKRALGAQL
jgi:hypothetical protein